MHDLIALCAASLDFHLAIQARIPETFKKGKDYYELRYKESAGSVLVASSGWDQERWTVLENDSLLIVDRNNRSISTLDI